MPIEFSLYLNKISVTNFLIIAVTISIFLIVCKIAFRTSNFVTIILVSALNLLICISYLLMHAPDVALTEAAIGSCFSAILFLIVNEKINCQEESKISYKKYFLAIIISFIFGFMFYKSYGFLLDIGDEKNPIHLGVSKYYLDNTQTDIGIPAFVAAILASYRGFDTFGETIVIFVAGLSVFYILGGSKKNVSK